MTNDRFGPRIWNAHDSLWTGSMEMHVLPLAVTPLPDPGLREGLGRRRAVCRYTLIEANVRHESDVPHDANAGRAHGGVVLALRGADIEVETVKAQSLDKLPRGLRLEGGQRRIAQLFIRRPIPTGDAVEQALIQAQQFVDVLQIAHQQYGP